MTVPLEPVFERALTGKRIFYSNENVALGSLLNDVLSLCETEGSGPDQKM
jgi:hypothetical protein